MWSEVDSTVDLDPTRSINARREREESKIEKILQICSIFSYEIIANDASEQLDIRNIFSPAKFNHKNDLYAPSTIVKYCKTRKKRKEKKNSKRQRSSIDRSERDLLMFENLIFNGMG